MITLGNFLFPEHSTMARISLIEAKSKVRRTILIESLIRAADELTLHQQLMSLQYALEQFDQNQARLSLQPGRYCEGRRREFHVTLVERKAFAWVELTIFTNDRYERSLVEHEFTQETDNGQAQFLLTNAGNWNSPPRITLFPTGQIEGFCLVLPDNTFSLTKNISAGQSVVVDSVEQKVWINGEIEYLSQSLEFPQLTPGENEVFIQVTPPDVSTQCTVQFRDYWV